MSGCQPVTADTLQCTAGTFPESLVTVLICQFGTTARNDHGQSWSKCLQHSQISPSDESFKLNASV